MNRLKRPFCSFAVALAIVGCTTITEELPAHPTPVNPAVIVVLQPPPQPAPAPSAPHPAPNPAPGRGGAPLPPGVTPTADQVAVQCQVWVPPDGTHCPKNPSPLYQPALETAVTRLQREQPQIFDGYFVKDAVAYYNGVFANLFEAGYCAIVDSAEVAIAVRGTGNYRENYHILSSVGNVRYGINSHESACRR